MPVASVDRRPAAPPAVDDGDARMRFAFLAETSRCLADSLDFQTTVTNAASLVLPHFGTWCMVDIVERDESICRAAVVHPDPDKQRLARDFYRDHPPGRDDAIGAPRVIRTHHSEFVVLEGEGAASAIVDVAHRELLHALGAQSCLVVPMRAHGRTLGAITFVSDDLRRYDDADLLLAEDLGRRCAMAIDNARLYRTAEDARRSAEAAREEAMFAARRAHALREVADAARKDADVANRAKTSFLTTMSHEFRTPLHAILGFVGLLDDEVAGPLTPVQRTYLKRVGNASGNLLRLIEEVLTLSQVDAGQAEVHLDEVDLSTIVHEVADLLQPLVGSKQLTLTVDLPPAPVCCVMDAGKFRQIAINLAANAVKFTTTGEVRMSLVTDDARLILRVRDTGEGISAADAEHIFDAFGQAGPNDKLQRRGTGLGLTITRQLARLLGGDVELESAVGTGSSFTVTLPRHVARGQATYERRARTRGDGS